MKLVGSLVSRQHRVGRLHLIPGAADDESGGDVGAARVAGELGADEGVVREVALKALDHPVAVAPGVGAHLVHLEAVALRKADGVEPMPRPALAEAGRGEEPIDEIAAGRVRAARSDVCAEGLHVSGRRRQADKIEHHPPQERGRGRLWLEREALGRERFCDKGIDRVGDAGDLGQRRPDDRLEGPVGRRFSSVRKERGGECGDVVGPWGAGSHPAREDRALFRREGIGVGRHPGLGVVGRDAADDLARLWFPGHDPGEPGVAAGKRPLALIDPPAALGSIGPVAGTTAVGQERSDSGGEIRRFGGRWLRSDKPGAGQPRQHKPEGSEARSQKIKATHHVNTPRRPAPIDRSSFSLPSGSGTCQPRRCSRTSRSRAS